VNVPASAASATRYVLSAADSWLSFEARTTLHAVKGRTGVLAGFIDARFDEDGAIQMVPQPAMHVECAVEQLKSGNPMQDREMWKMIDSTRFPRIGADLLELRSNGSRGSYAASGNVTVAGRSRRYDGSVTIGFASEVVTVDGDLSVDIRDFGLRPPSLLLLKVDPIVKARLHMIAKKTG
jgi:hypothetical protein